MPPRILLASLLAAAPLLAGGPALADDVEQCIGDSDRAQTLRDDGKLLAARDLFVSCAREQCPAMIRSDCAAWLQGVEAKLPSVVLRARDASGRDLAAVVVSLDGQKLAERLDGRAVAVDPGERAFRFQVSGAAPIDERVVVHEGEKNRAIDVVFTTLGVVQATPGGAAQPPSTSAEPRRAIPVAAYILSGFGVVGIGGFTYFGLTAKSHRDDLRADCAPSCDESRVDAAKREQLFANVSLGVGVVALGAATWVVLGSRPSAVPAATGGATRSRAPKAAADLRLLPGGGVAMIRGAF